MTITSRNKLSFVAAITAIWPARPVLVRAQPPLMMGVSRLLLLLVMLGIALANLEAQVKGAGTPGQIPYWMDPTTLADSTLSQNSGGDLKAICQSPGLLACLSASYDTQGASAISGSNTSFGGTGVQGLAASGDGVAGSSSDGRGVLGVSTSGRGVEGQSDSRGGVAGISNTGDGIGGITNGGGGAAAVFGAGQTAGNFLGNFLVTGLKLFRIDHPLDPANKYLSHSVIESPDVLNLYNGNIITDLSGYATVQLPDYFRALNRDFRYQLTVIGQFAQAIVASEIDGNRFTIKTDKPNVKVSWQVTGIRQDAWAKAHPMQVEQEKPEKARGTYLHPELYDQPEEKGLLWLEHPDLMQHLKVMREKGVAGLRP